MSIVESPHHVRRPEQVEALIEEARRRARRRRQIRAAALVTAVAAGVAAYAIVSSTGGGGSSATAVPAGFTAVQARGPVRHMLVEQIPTRIASIELASGASHPARLTQEVFYDSRTQLYRVVARVDGRVESDLVGHANCFPLPGGRRTFCLQPGPFGELQRAPRWPLDPSKARVVGHGSVRGLDVVWVESLVRGRPIPGGGRPEAWGFDSRTHELLVLRQGPALLGKEVFTQLGTLPASRVTFAVPENGTDQHSFPPEYPSTTRSRAVSLDTARTALPGAAPLWLGPRFRGHRLRGVKTGTEGMRGKNGRVLLPAPFVSFDYGVVKLKEFGATRPWTYLHGPQPGRLLLDTFSVGELVRGGVLVTMGWGPVTTSLDRATSLAVARALRPLR